MNIVRLLNLYKQHSLKDYLHMAKKQYSCWGYFDCMSVELVRNREERGLLMQESRGADMTDLWYASAESTEDLNGYYGQQSIGMFRYESKGKLDACDADFWQQGKEGIILIACMIQTADNVEVIQSMIEIEEDICNLGDESQNIQGITYRTFDNSDIILFLKGNCYAGMTDIITKVGERPDVKYKYSICGIAQEYLDRLDKIGKIDEVEYNERKLINDKIAEVWLQIVSDEKADLNSLLAFIGGNAVYTKVLGNVDHIIRIQDTDIQQVVSLLRGGEQGVTHENKQFTNGIYNISTVILRNWASLEQGNQIDGITSDNDKTDGWCMREIKKLAEYKHELNKCKNEVLYSNWLALIRVLNVLSQYENSAFSKYIFRILFPSVQLMCRKFENIVEKYSENEKFVRYGYEKIESFEEYIAEVDGMMRHLFHTSQTFLSAPGYNGSLYDIPTKLLLFYMAYAHKLIEIYKDSGQEFTCFICPLMNHKPDVREIENGDGREALLDVRMAQRHLYMPRAFLIILSHEMFHYVGNESRCRQVRADCLIKMCTYAIVYKLFSHQDDADVKGGQDDIAQKEGIYIKGKQEEIQDFLLQAVADDVKKKTAGEGDKKYLSETLKPMLEDSFYNMISRPEYGLDKVLRQINMQDLHKNERIKSIMKCWSDVLQNVEINRKNLDSDLISEIVKKFIYSFQEIYADIASIICLRLELKYYLETILVSEGMVMDDTYDSIIVINRFAVVIYALRKSSSLRRSYRCQWEKLRKDKEILQGTLIKKIDQYIQYMTARNRNEQLEEKKEGNDDKNYRKDDIEWPFFNLDGVWYEQVKYAEKCIKNLQKCICSKDENEIKSLRKVFNLFSSHKTDDKSLEDLFEVSDKLVADYNTLVDDMGRK